MASDACAIAASSRRSPRPAGQRVALGADAVAQLLDLALGLQNAARVLAPAAAHDVRTAEHIALERRRPGRRSAGSPRARRRSRRDPGIANRLANRARERTVDANDRRQRRRAIGQAPRSPRRRSPADRPAAGHGIAHQCPTCTMNPQRPASCSRTSCKPGGGMLRPLDDDVLQQIAEAGLDRALVAGARPRDSRRPRPAGRPSRWPARAPRARRRRIRRAPRRALRATSAAPRAPASSCSRDRTDARAPLVLDARARQLRLARGARDPRRLDRVVRAPQPPRRQRRDPPPRAPTRSARRSISTSSLASVSATRSRAAARVLQRVAQRGGGVDRREHLAARRLDVRLEPFDFALRRRRRRPASAASVAAARSRFGRARRPQPSRRDVERCARRLAARLEPLELGRRPSPSARRALDLLAGRTRSAAAGG